MTSAGKPGLEVANPRDAHRWRLCYVSGQWAWFTTQPVTRQWGDDWNDAPYEHNAGDPYLWRPDRTSRGKAVDRYALSKVAWDGPLEDPSDWAAGGNSHYSVEMINAGAIPWLKTDRFARPGTAHVEIPAGTPIAQFAVAVNAVKGQVYFPLG